MLQTLCNQYLSKIFSVGSIFSSSFLLQITACVDFTLTISHLDPQIPVKVEFRLEGQRFRHEPGQFRFREKWLSDIIDHKKKLIRQVSL